jgi:hypothetical protein
MDEAASHTNFHGPEAPARTACPRQSALLASSRRQFVRFSLGWVRRVRCKIHSNTLAAHHGQNGSGLGPERDQHGAAFVSVPPTFTRGRKITVAASIVRIVGRPLEATSLVHQHLKQRRIGQPRPGHPAGISRNAASPRALFCFLPGGFESGRCTPARAGEASSVRPEPAHIDQHYTTNITDRHQHYPLSRPFLWVSRI